MNRDDIHLISRYSNWSENGVDHALKVNVYSDSQSWKKFLQFLFISLGVGFTVSGIVFFFAYNWADLHKFVKIGMVEGGIVITTLFIILSKYKQDIKNIILTGSSVLVGVLFAVFGQIYQTGANAYDFFLGWTVFVSLWVIISNFAPLWVVYLALINTTLFFYSHQVAQNWSPVFVFTLLFLINSSALVISFYLPKTKGEFKVPGWFTKALALAAITFSTIGISLGIHEDYEASFSVLLMAGILLYAIGLYYGIRTRSKYYLSIILFSVILIFNSLLFKISDGEAMLLFISVFVIVSVTMVIKFLISIQKKWDNE